MKKSVLALAVLGTFAGAASAQGSVTLFGVVDLNARVVKNDDTTYQLAQDGMASSRLGFRGVEDLGGGLKASFWLEAALGPDTGTGSSSFGNGNALAGNQFEFRRRSTVSLSNRWGELRLGRDYTPQFWNWTVFDPFGTNGVGAASNLFLQANATAGSGGSYGTLVRANNTIGYFLPNGGFGPGLYGQAMISAGENAPGNKMWGGRIGYAAGPFNVAFAYSDTDVTEQVGATNWNLGGSWDFGFMKLSGFYSEVKVDGFLASGNQEGGQDNWFLGVSAPLGQANLKASWGQADGTGFASGLGAKQWAIGADYNLSKRTAVYATWSQINNNSSSAFRISATGSALTAGTSSTGGEVGIRHTF